METELFGHTPIWVRMGHGPKAKTALQRPLVRALVIAAPRAADPPNGDRVVVWLYRHLLYYAGPGGLVFAPASSPPAMAKQGLLNGNSIPGFLAHCKQRLRAVTDAESKQARHQPALCPMPGLLTLHSAWPLRRRTLARIVS
jgi:hypothetical protein